MPLRYWAVLLGMLWITHAGAAGLDRYNGRPVGLQIIGNYFSEAKMLNVAHQLQQVTDWHTRAPVL